MMIDSFTGEYGFLSNFYPCPIELDGELYPSVEHAFQAAKTDDFSMRWLIMNASTAGAAKKFGRTAPLRKGWDEMRVEVMRGLLKQKFRYLPLAQKLRDTGEAELIEGNWWGDQFWGVCHGKGKNHLGRLLMEIRKEL